MPEKFNFNLAPKFCSGETEIFGAAVDFEAASAQDPAIEFCGGCPPLLKSNCLAQSIVGPKVYGVWGGKTAVERRELVKRVGDRLPMVLEILRDPEVVVLYPATATLNRTDADQAA